MGFFDNMGDRPIASSEWQHYEIVGDIAADAQAIVFGVMALGKCVVLVDDATLEVVDAEVAPTGSVDALANAPQQPFFTWWLVLPLAGIALFALAYLSRSRLGKLAFEFTFVYWALYVFSSLLANLVPFVGGSWSRAFEAGPLTPPCAGRQPTCSGSRASSSRRSTTAAATRPTRTCRR
jgi:hypothetical protein